jgi:DNA-binding CsgD family transcriptional regulator
MRAFLAVVQADPAAAHAALARALPLIRETGDPRFLVDALSIASVAQNMGGEHAHGAQLANDANSLAETGDDAVASGAAAYAQGINALFDGDFELARAMYSKSADAWRGTGYLFGVQFSLIQIAVACFLGGERAASRPLLLEALSIARRLDDRVAQFYLLYCFSGLAAFSGEERLAAQLLGAGERLRTEVGTNVFDFASTLAQSKEAAIAAIGDKRFEAEFNAGRQLSREAALSLAMGESPRADAEAPADARTDPLGKREAAVARLVGEGLSNKEIGARLFISDRTVESHVRSIMNKLGFNSRARIAGWIASSPDRAPRAPRRPVR